MLRGQASLQELIGRSFMTRKRPPKSKKKAAAIDSASTSHDLDTIQSVSAYAAAPKERSLHPGHALCPVCGLPTPERMMNTHLDTCLAQETLQRSKGDAKQSTLQRFASTSSGIDAGPKPAAPRQLRREIAQHLSGLLDAGSVKVTATVDEPESVAAAVPILLEMSHVSGISSKEDVDQTLALLVKAAADWQASGLQRQGSNTGACLRSNFLLMADIVVNQDLHLLVDQETQLLTSFKALTDEAQCLFLRLFLRKGPWTTGISKGQMLQLLKAGLEKVEGSAAEAPFKQEVLTSIGPCIKLQMPMCSFINRVQRLFFLNEAQNLSSFLIADLGVAKYPGYAVTRSRSVFTNRQDLLDYEQALQHAAELDNALEDLDTDAADKALEPAFAAINADLHKQQPSACGGGCSATQMPFFLRYSSAWVYAAMATTGVSLMEKRKQWQQAVELLQQLLGGVCCLRRRGEWWTRLSLDLEHLGRPDESLEMAEAALADEWVINGDRVALQRRVLRLGKPPRRWKRPSWASVAMREPLEVRIEGQPLNSVLGIKSRFVGNGGDECSVEELALQYYAAEAGGNWTGTHAEGGIWATLFGLLIGVNWDRHGLDDLDTIAKCVGGRGLAAVCRLLAEDFSGWAGGMPDLLLWNVNTCKAKLSEVKGPRDRLSEQQRAWINALIDAEVDVEVLKVVEPRQGNAPKRRRKW
ncbi:hypothetical protein WJX79_004346 [Trebouxia sp. C0005]